MLTIQVTLYNLDNQCLPLGNIAQAGKSIFTLQVTLYNLDNQCLPFRQHCTNWKINVYTEGNIVQTGQSMLNLQATLNTAQSMFTP